MSWADFPENKDLLMYDRFESSQYCSLINVFMVGKSNVKYPELGYIIEERV